MGICGSGPELLSSKEPIYTSITNFYVPYHDNRLKIVCRKKVSCNLPFPVNEFFKNHNLLNHKIVISGCVLPGIDLTHTYFKECQDIFLCVTTPEYIISVLLDGHGKNGKSIVEYCKKHIERYCNKKCAKIQADPSKYTRKIITNCDKYLLKSDVDCSLSGTTAVVVYFDMLSLQVSSVGDSRAIIATKNIPTTSSHKTKLKAVPLTIDQKPNHDLEFKRISESGGLIQKVSTKDNKFVGPYRVWVKGTTLPGLAMSRSIGDELAKSVGVISSPISQSFLHHSSTDRFIIIASDGI